MYNKDAIKSLEYTKRHMGLPEQGSTWSPNRETIAIDMAINVLKRQIPQEVRNIYPVEVKDPGVYILTGNCPVCGSAVPAEHWYCWSCGQRLDWSQD